MSPHEHFSGEFKFDPRQSEKSVKLEWVKFVVKVKHSLYRPGVAQRVPGI